MMNGSCICICMFRNINTYDCGSENKIWIKHQNPDPHQNEGDSDRSIPPDHRGTIHTRFLSHSHMLTFLDLHVHKFCYTHLPQNRLCSFSLWQENRVHSGQPLWQPPSFVTTAVFVVPRQWRRDASWWITCLTVGSQQRGMPRGTRGTRGTRCPWSRRAPASRRQS